MLAGCSTTPAFAPTVAPEAPVAFKEGGQRWINLAPAEGQARGTWWRAFSDPVLDDLVARASAGNTSIQAAARAARRGARAAARRQCRPAAASRREPRRSARHDPAGPRRAARPGRQPRPDRPVRVVGARLLRQADQDAQRRGARRAVARGAVAEHPARRAVRCRAGLLRPARDRRRPRARAPDRGSLPGHAAPDGTPLRRGRRRRARPRARAGRSGRDEVAGARARPRSRGARTRARGAAGRGAVRLLAGRGRLVWRAADHPRRRAERGARAPPRRRRGAAVDAGRGSARRRVAPRVVPRHRLDRQWRCRIDGHRRPVRLVGARVGHRRADVAARVRRRPPRGRRAERERAMGHRRRGLPRAGARRVPRRRGPAVLAAPARRPGRRAEGGRRRGDARDGAVRHALPQRPRQPARAARRAPHRTREPPRRGAGARRAVRRHDRPDPRARRRLERRPPAAPTAAASAAHPPLAGLAAGRFSRGQVLRCDDPEQRST